jgi:hypothetical protein
MLKDDPNYGGQLIREELDDLTVQATLKPTTLIPIYVTLNP